MFYFCVAPKVTCQPGTNLLVALDQLCDKLIIDFEIPLHNITTVGQ